MKELLEKLTSISGVSGNEEEIAQVISDEIGPYVDEIKSDALGNLICVKKGSGRKLMLAAHMDEVGIIVTHIDDNGFLRFSGLGGINHFYSLHQKVVFKNGTYGSISYEEQVEELKDLKLGKMYIDIGARDKQDAEKKSGIGDTAAFVGNFSVNDNMVISKALDDRAGCAVLIEAAKKLKNNHNEIYYVFTTQEELGLRGAKTAAYSVNPEMAIAVDVTNPGDTPNAKPSPLKCGNGPIIKIMDRASITHPEVKKLLVESAQSAGIPYQLKVAVTGGTDAGAISISREGVPTGSVAIPCRYLHSPVEMVDMNDLVDTVRLIEESVERIK